MTQKANRHNRLRFSLVLMIGAYPLITAILYVLGPWEQDWPLPLRTLTVVPFMVLGMVYLIIPQVNRCMGWWINR